MKNKLLKKILQIISTEIPYRETMDEYLDYLTKELKHHSEDLVEKKHFIEKPWIEVRDTDDFHEKVLHFFNSNDEYLYSIDGNVSKGKWRILDKSNKLLIERLKGGKPFKTELFDLAYLGNPFFILKKHGDQHRKGDRKYLALGHEPAMKKYTEWKDFIDLFWEHYQSKNLVFVVIVAIVILITLVVFWLSIF